MKIRKKSDIEKELVKLQQRIIELEESETQGKQAELENVLNTSPIHIASIDISGKYTSWNKASEDMFGFTAQEVIGILTPRRFHCNDKEAKAVIDTVEREGKFDDEITLIRKDGSEFPAHLLVSKTIDSSSNHIGYSGVAVDISERKQSEKIQLVLSYIANAVNTTKNLEELYKIIHKQLGKIIDTTNFYIANYNEETEEITASYFIDEMFDVKPPVKLRVKGFTAYIIRNKKSLFLTEEKRKKLIELGEIADREWKSNIWLGVPLIIENRIVGALAVLSYRDESVYTERDLSLLEFVADAIAIAIARKRSEEALKESEDRYRNIFDLMPNPVIIHSEGKIVAGNKAALKFSKVENHEEFIGSPVINFVHPDYREKVAKRIRKIIKGKGPANLIEEKFINAKNEIRDVEVAAIPTKFGVKDSVLVAFRDITERKQAVRVQLVLYNITKAVNTTKDLDELYHTIHQHLSTVIDTTNFYIALYDEDKNVIAFPYYIDEKDPKPEPVPKKLSKGLTEYVIRTGMSLLAPKEFYMRLAKEGKIEISGSISEVWIGIPLRIEKKIIGVMAIQSYKDASIYNEKDLEILELISYQIAIAIENKKTEQINLRLSEIIRNACDGIILTNPEGQITYVNPAFEKMSGYKMNELLNTDPDILIVKQDKTAPNGAIRSAVKARGEWKGELYCKRKNEEIYPIDTRVFAIKNAKDELVEIAAIQQDITKRKKAEAELQRSEEQFRLFVENVPGVVSIYNWYPDEHRELIYHGPGLDKILGKELAEKVEKNPDTYFELIPEDDLTALEEASLKALKTDKQLDFEYRLKIDDSNIKWVRALFSMFTKENGVILWQGIIYDITERKQAEKVLAESELQFRSLSDASMEGIGIIQDGKVLIANNKACELFDYAQNEIVGKPLLDFIALESKELALKNFRDRYKKPFEVVAIRKDGSKFLAEVCGKSIEFKGQTGRVIAIRDITERKQAEEDIKKRMDEIETFNKLAVGREMRMINLKKEINELLMNLGKEPKYKIAE